MALIPTETDPRAETLSDIRNTVVGAYNMLRGAFDHLQGQTWTNPRGLTPQEVFDVLGTDAAELVQLSQQIAALINAKCLPADAVKSLAPEGTTLTANADGTITVS